MRDKPGGNRKKVIDRMLTVDWRNGLNSNQVAELDLAYYSQHSNLKTWKALKLDYGDSCKFVFCMLLSWEEAVSEMTREACPF
jgi:hypothetical protein